jgi:hypothetical protein
LVVKVHAVDELADEIEAATLCFVQLLRPDRLRDCRRVEARALIRDVDPNRFRDEFSANFNPLLWSSALPRRMALLSASESTTRRRKRVVGLVS